MLDIFNSDAFGVVPLTDAINKVKFVPGYVSGRGLFLPTGVTTTSVAIEERDGILSLIAPSPRGGPGTTLDKQKRNLRNIAVPHFQIDDAIMAEEVQGVRAFGSETAVEMVMDKVMERGQIHSQSLAATQEYSRVGAIKGVVTYADGTTLDLFALFGVTQETEIAFDFANTPAGSLMPKVHAVHRQIANILDGVPFSGIEAICGDAFFDDLTTHAEVRETFLNQQEASDLRRSRVTADGDTFGSFNFGNIRWTNYRGSVGGTAFVESDKCHLFPIGVPGLFRTYYAPADYIETVNTRGQRLYVKQWPMQNGKGVNLEVQSNCLEICTRPKVLVPGRRGA